MPINTIAILYPGAMGTSLARVLSARLPHLTLLTSLSGRSPSTIARAEASGLENVALGDLVRRSDLILSILPPGAAVSLAREITGHLRQSNDEGQVVGGRKTPVYVDANAIAPETVSQIASILKPFGVPFLDGSIIGFPATADFSSVPKLYISSIPELQPLLREVAAVLSGGGDDKGLRIRVMEDAGEGGASALKMCYGGINKGVVGLATLMILSAAGHSPGTSKALVDEMAESQPALTQKLVRALPDMLPKAYRWVGEMEEISSFITSSILASAPPQGASPAEAFQGLAATFQRMADDVRSLESQTGTGDGSGAGQDVKTVLEWTKEGKGRYRQ